MHSLGPLALLSLPRRMRVLVAISILAFLALLWASVAIFRHIRRAQRRRRRSLESSANSLSPTPPDRFVIAPPPSATVAPEITFTDPEAPVPEVAFTDTEAPIPEPSPAYQPVLRLPERQNQSAQPILYATPAPEPTTLATTEGFLDTLPPPPDPALSPRPAWPHFGFTPARPVASKEPIPYAAPPSGESSAAVVRAPIEIQPPAPAVKPLYPSAHPTIAEAPPPPPPPVPQRSEPQPMRRVDWAYFNKDMGDLSDPAPAGSRPKIPAIRTTTSE